MAKVSRPIIYVAVLGAIAYAAVLYTEPEKPAVKTVRRAAPAAPAPKGYAPEDLNAVFPRYVARSRDAFLPKIVSEPRAGTAAPGTGTGSAPDMSASLAAGVWMLTGITSVNGVRTALLENGSAGESVFLKAGDIWNGLRVAAVEQNAVVMVSPSGKKTRFGFPAFDAAPVASAPVPAPAIPGVAPGYTPVAPVIIPPPPGFRGPRSNAPLVAVPIPGEPQTSPRAPRSLNSDNQTNSAPSTLSTASDTSQNAATGQRSLNE